MYPLVLKTDVSVEGLDFFGRKAETVFCPSELPGLRWGLLRPRQLDSCAPRIIYPITSDIAEYRKRRIRLSNYFYKGGVKGLEIYEHIGILQWFGLSGVTIFSDKWPPYSGRSWEFWSAIRPFCRRDESSGLKWHTVKNIVNIEPLAKFGQKEDKRRYLAIFPASKKELELEITVDYPGLGKRISLFFFPNEELLEKICSALTVGWPPYLRHISKTLSVLGFWPHHERIVWPDRQDKKKILDDFVLHRAADLLGALSLLCRDGLFAGRVVSYCAGHAIDLKAIKAADNLLCPLG